MIVLILIFQFILLQEYIPAEAIKRGFDVSPDSIYGFTLGLLLIFILLGIAAFIAVFKFWRADQKKSQEMAERNIGVLEKNNIVTERQTQTLDQLKNYIEQLIRQK